MVSDCHQLEKGTKSDVVRMLGQKGLRQKLALMPSVVLFSSTSPLTRFVLHYCEYTDINFEDDADT